MHFHALNCSFCPVVVILIHISSLLLGTVRGRLFAIIKSLQHSCVGTRFWQQEVVLEYSVVLSWGSLLLVLEFRRSIILQVLHEARLGFVHNIIVMGSALLWRIVKARSCCVRTRAKAGVVHVGFVLVILCLSTNDGPSSVGKFTSCIGFIWLVESVGMTISCRFSSSTCGRVISTWNLRVIELSSVVIQVGNISQGAHVLIIDWLLATMGSRIRGWVELVLVVVVVIVVLSLITIYRHVIHRIASTSSLSLFAQFCLGDGFGNWREVVLVILRRVEKLRSHHHLLLGVPRAVVRVRSFSLIHQVEQVSLVVSSWGICSSNSLISNSTGIGCETTASISITCHSLVLVLAMTTCLGRVAILASIALP